MAATHAEATDVRTARIRRGMFVACASFLLALFGVLGIMRLVDDARGALAAAPEAQENIARAGAERTNAAIAHAWGVLAGATELAKLGNLAETAPEQVAAAAARAQGVAGAVVLSSDGAVRAATRASLIAAAHAARDQLKDGDAWTGVVETQNGLHALILARRANGSAIVSIFDAQEVMPPPTPGAQLLLVAQDGQIVAAQPALSTRRANLAKALNLRANGPVASHAVFSDVTLAGASLAVGSAGVATAGLQFYAAAPVVSTWAALFLALAPDFIIFGAPLFAAIVLLRLWMRQSTRAETAEVELVSTQNRFRLAVDGARAGVFEWRLDAHTIELSERIVQLVGAPSELMRFDAFLTLVAVEDRAAVEEAFAKARESGVLDTSFRLRGGNHVVFVEARGLAIEDPSEPGIVSVVGTLIDVTPRREAELRVNSLERRLREAIDSYSGPFALWDARKRLVMWNRSYARAFNLPQAVLRAGAPYDSVNAAAFKEVSVARQDPADPHTQEIELKTGLWLQLVERRTAEGGLVIVGADITALKRQEEALARSQRNLRSMVSQLETSEGRNKELARKYEEEKRRAEDASRAKSAFLANMSHELRTPLNAINGFSELMVSEIFGSLGDKHYTEYAKDILASGQLLLDLINDILDMAKIESGKITLTPAPLDPKEAVEGAVRLMRGRAQEKSLTLVVEANNPPQIEADHRAVKQMMLNLLSNAIKFTEEGGVIVRIKAASAGGMSGVSISVVDTGPGIPQEHLPRLGRAFEQVDMRLSRKTGGTGLGLALTKSLAEMHGGRLDIDSEVGRGTIVSLFLPLRAQVRGAPEEHEQVA